MSAAMNGSAGTEQLETFARRLKVCTPGAGSTDFQDLARLAHLDINNQRRQLPAVLPASNSSVVTGLGTDLGTDLGNWWHRADGGGRP